MNGVAIVGSLAEGRVDKNVLQAESHKIRAGVSCIPDLILSRSGHTAAFILLDHAVVPELSEKELKRIEELGKSFTHSFVLAAAPLERMAAPQYFELAVGVNGSDIMVFGPATNLTQKAVEVLATMLAPANESPDHIDARRLALVQDYGGVGCFIRKLPSFSLTEAEADSLALCGSIKDLTMCTLQDIVDFTELSHDRAEQLLNFFGGS